MARYWNREKEVVIISILDLFNNRGNKAVETSDGNRNISEPLKGMLYSPLAGEVIPLQDVSDPVFSQGIMGTGVAIRPGEGVLYSPVNGIVAALFPTNHAIGIQSDDGAELLIHVGIDTVVLEGEGFSPYIKQGERVTAGQKLLSFNINMIEQKGLEATTMILISNHQMLGTMKILASGAVKPFQPMIQFSEKQ